jgi:hypothetical protein
VRESQPQSVVLARLPAWGGSSRSADNRADSAVGVATAKNIHAMTNDDVLDEAMDNLREARQRIRATQHLMRSQGMTDNEDYRELIISLSSALAMTEAAYLEARRHREM